MCNFFNRDGNLRLNSTETDFGLVWGGVVIFDSTIFALTVYKSLSLWRQGSRGLVHIVMRDGKFFLVLGLH